MTNEHNAVVERKWYEQPWVIIALLVFFFPAGLYLMWRHASWHQWIKWAISGGFAVLFVAAAVSGALGGDDDAGVEPEIAPTDTPTLTLTPSPTHTPRPTNTPGPTDTPAPTNTPRPPTATPVPLDQRPESDAIRATIHGYFDAYNDLVSSVVSTGQGDAIAVLRFVDRRADAECNPLDHAFAYVLMARQFRERVEVVSVTINDLDVDGSGLAQADI